VDNDQALEIESGLTRDELSVMPVPALHRLESDHARILCEMEAPVIGGLAASVADDAAAVNRLATSGLCVYLAQTLESVMARVGLDGVGRQALVGDPSRLIRERFLRRDPVYRRMASLIVDAERPPRDTCEQIVAALGGWQTTS
jgi:shikimate kinase